MFEAAHQSLGINCQGIGNRGHVDVSVEDLSFKLLHGDIDFADHLFDRFGSWRGARRRVCCTDSWLDIAKC
ncbi:MAG: hypothetical protein A2511_16680 [Deltaproteobacteria bacterium RIFOXYD12_FULL_50_9]|nr:MAG: hypothetical protein A2511_16680 [Deltaproteobacteria bacterium RIFOXYD12_FULL_50_9]